jgi:hypothetical protein
MVTTFQKHNKSKIVAGVGAFEANLQVNLFMAKASISHKLIAIAFSFRFLLLQTKHFKTPSH